MGLAVRLMTRTFALHFKRVWRGHNHSLALLPSPFERGINNWGSIYNIYGWVTELYWTKYTNMLCHLKNMFSFRHTNFYDPSWRLSAVFSLFFFWLYLIDFTWSDRFKCRGLWCNPPAVDLACLRVNLQLNRKAVTLT